MNVDSRVVPVDGVWFLIDPQGKIVATEQSCVKAWARMRGYKLTIEGMLAFEQQGWRVVPDVPAAPPAGGEAVGKIDSYEPDSCVARVRIGGEELLPLGTKLYTRPADCGEAVAYRMKVDDVWFTATSEATLQRERVKADISPHHAPIEPLFARPSDTDALLRELVAKIASEPELHAVFNIFDSAEFIAAQAHLKGLT